jgi:hypothetical protein
MILTDDPDTPCQACPDNQPASPDALMCGTCPPGTGRSADLRSCTACPVGTYNDADDLGMGCAECAENTYGHEVGASKCVSCPADHISLPGSVAAEDCVEVISCGPGTYPTQDESDPCACDLDGVVHGIDTGRVGCADHGTTDGVVCYVSPACASSSASSSYPGTNWRLCYPLVDSLLGACDSCPAGYFNDSPDDGICSPCPAGSYAAVNGSSSCILCEPGKFNGGEGASGCSECAVSVAEGSRLCPAQFVEAGYLDMKAKFGNGAVSEEAVREGGVDTFVVRAGR